jgi:nitric oxide reductase NorD protein
MPEAEDVITDAARHATVFVQDLWRRQRGGRREDLDEGPAIVQRLDLLLTGTFAQSFNVRPSQPPAPVTLVRRLFARAVPPVSGAAIPATDGISIWLPLGEPRVPIATLQILALQQAARAARGAAACLAQEHDPWVRAVFEVLQADAADAQLMREFPGLVTRIEALRNHCVSTRPALDAFARSYRAVESWLRDVLQRGPDESLAKLSCEQALRQARVLGGDLTPGQATQRPPRNVLFRDSWTGELREPPASTENAEHAAHIAEHEASEKVRSARLRRTPNVRKPDERDEQSAPGAWMVQTAQPHEHAEDPFGMQRPTDHDEREGAEEMADSVAELTEARLVSVPGTTREVLLSDDPLQSNVRAATPLAKADAQALRYPEWDWRANAYRHPGATVHLLEPSLGSREWVNHTLDHHRALLQAVRRQFESLRAQRTRLRQQPEGDEVDLQACLDALADIRAGTAVERGLYQSIRPSTRELAVLLLIDVSGSTDGWVSQHRRVIDVEREALLLVCLALESLAEPYSVLAFSGLSAHRVTVRTIKGFADSYREDIALRIAGLQPEQYTRAGAAIRHASHVLMQQPARHRLLIVLSDGKPNDVDEYDGRYGVEDMRQSIIEARLQGIFPFCLTIDRHVATYLPAVFGEHQYAVLHRPDALPTALLGWLRRLVQA